jgi:hypothetical protein
LGTRSKRYSKPEQPPPSTLIRNIFLSGSLQTICAMRWAARSVTVMDAVVMARDSLFAIRVAKDGGLAAGRQSGGRTPLSLLKTPKAKEILEFLRHSEF